MLIATRGCSGSGKSTAAKKWVAENVARRCRVNSDRIGDMLHGVAFTGVEECENAITAIKLAGITTLLSCGFDVITDDTYISNAKFDRVVGLANSLGVEVVVWDLRHLPLEVCVKQDAMRSRVVGEEEIRRQHRIMLDEMRVAGVSVPTVQSNVESLVYATIISSHTLDGRLAD
jgi:predicted kinase